MTEEVPLSRRVTLEPQPTSVAAARGVVRELLAGSALADISDEAVLLVSEVVTNAVLHAGSQVEMSCEITEGILCVEVRDGSAVVPAARHFDVAAMTGRGLGMVERIASAWGVEPHTDGKTVWFQLASPSAAPAALPGRAREGAEAGGAAATCTVRLQNVPVPLLATTIQHGDTLLRELTLRSIAEGAFEVPGPHHTPHLDLGPVLEAVEAADGASGPVDVVVSLPAGSGAAAAQRLSSIEEAEALARRGELLTVAELPEITACRNWLLGQITSQEAGAEPVAWELPPPLAVPGELEPLPAAQRDRLDRLGTGAVVADEANQIIYANADAARLLGWDAGELTGQRLISIIPEHMREAHLAGFGRYLLTREPRLLGQQVIVPALRRDGTSIDVTLLLSTLDDGRGRTTFLARLAPLEIGAPPSPR